MHVNKIKQQSNLGQNGFWKGKYKIQAPDNNVIYWEGQVLGPTIPTFLSLYLHAEISVGLTLAEVSHRHEACVALSVTFQSGVPFRALLCRCSAVVSRLEMCLKWISQVRSTELWCISQYSANEVLWSKQVHISSQSDFPWGYCGPASGSGHFLIAFWCLCAFVRSVI